MGGTYNYTKVDPEQGTSTDRSSFGVLPSLNLSAVYAHWTGLDGEEDAEADRFTVGLGISIYP